MVHFEYGDLPSKRIDIAHIVQINAAAFTEEEIIQVNDILLSNGLHRVRLKNKMVGRKIIDTFLSLLNCYENIYWLGPEGSTPVGTINVYELLSNQGCFQNNAALYDLMATQFYPSCLVIEVSDILESQSWYKNFYVSLKDNHLLENIPVICLEFIQ